MKFAALALSFALALGSVGGAQAYTIYNTLGGVENGGDALAVAGPYLNDWIKTGSTASLSSATFNLSLAGAPTGSFQVWAAKIDSSAPSGISQYATLATVADNTLTSNFATYTFSPYSTYKLDANSFYVVGLHDNGSSDAVWGNTVDPMVLSRPSVIAGEYYYNNGGVQANAGGPYELSVNVAGVPEPASWALMLVGVGAMGGALRSRRRAVAATA